MKDLIRLYHIESVHPKEAGIYTWIREWLDDNEIDYETDGVNIWRLTGKNIILSAHMDQVETNGQAEHFYKDGERISGYNKDYEQTSLGADDKNGIWIILKALEHNKDTDFIISTGEEVGCVGIDQMKKNGVLEDITDKSVCFVLDRRGFGEVLQKGSTGPYCNTLAQVLCNFFNQDCPEPIFEVSDGTLSDTSRLCERCESVNISVAYYNPHSSKETTDFDELQFTKDKIIDALDNFVYYPCPVDTYIKPKGGYYGRTNYLDDYGQYSQGSFDNYWGD